MEKSKEEKSKETEFLRVFMNHLKDLVKEAPYVIFIFISPVLLIIALTCGQTYIGFFFSFFLYSVFGIVWRHAIKDIRGRLKESFPENFTKTNLRLTEVYQIVNVLAVVILVLILKQFIIK